MIATRPSQPQRQRKIISPVNATPRAIQAPLDCVKSTTPVMLVIDSTTITRNHQSRDLQLNKISPKITGMSSTIVPAMTLGLAVS